MRVWVEHLAICIQHPDSCIKPLPPGINAPGTPRTAARHPPHYPGSPGRPGGTGISMTYLIAPPTSIHYSCLCDQAHRSFARLLVT